MSEISNLGCTRKTRIFPQVMERGTRKWEFIYDQLKNTGKGKLSYERETKGPSLKALLSECSSPPSIRVSPKFSQSLKNRSLKGKEDNEEEKNDNERSKQKSLDSAFSGMSPGSPRTSVGSGEGVKNVKSPVTSPEFGKSRVALRRYEEELENKARKARLEKQREFEELQSKLEQEAELKMQEIDRKANFDTLMKIQNINLRNESQAAEIVKQHRMLKETHEQRKQIHDATIQEAEEVRRKIQLEETRRREQENKERQEKLAASVSELEQLNSKIQREVAACRYQDQVSPSTKKALVLIQSLMQNAEGLKQGCRQAGKVNREDFEKCRDVLDRASNAYEFIKKDLERAEKEGKAAEAEQEKQARLAEEQAAAQAAAQTAAQASASGPSLVSTSDLSATAAAREESLCVDLEAFRKYTELQNKLQEVEQLTAGFSSTPELKKLKFDIQKAVNTAINAISPVSGEHLRDKLKRLLQLLAGQRVDGAGRQFSLNQHQHAPLFCKNLIAKMFVRKGEEQVSSNYESAFAIALVAAGLWQEHSDLGDLLLAHFYAQCPYLVPYYIPKQEGQTDEEYFKSRGYKYEGGVVEKHDKFLKRISGIMRLYFSIIVSAPPRGSHPHGIEQAWVWLTRTLNLDPEPDITATMIYDCLQVTGNALCREYKKQFLKLLHILVKEMLPKLKSVSTDAGSGSLTRLQSLLETSVKHHGNIPLPEGFLEHRFWLS